MAIQPGQYNFPLQRRADHSITLQFKSSKAYLSCSSRPHW